MLTSRRLSDRRVERFWDLFIESEIEMDSALLLRQTCGEYVVAFLSLEFRKRMIPCISIHRMGGRALRWRLHYLT